MERLQTQAAERSIYSGISICRSAVRVRARDRDRAKLVPNAAYKAAVQHGTQIGVTVVNRRHRVILLVVKLEMPAYGRGCNREF